MSWTMPAEMALTGLTLRVRDVDTQVEFYRDRLGLDIVSREKHSVSLAPAARRFTLTLVHEPKAPIRPYPCVGLYHVALVVPIRPALATIYRRLAEQHTPFEGFSDHGVSEALYLRDPEGNGIELYWDRPRSSWPMRDGGVIRSRDRARRLKRDGRLEMYTNPLNMASLLEESDHSGSLDAETTFGHVHLHVGRLEDAESFYVQTLGLGMVTKAYPGALFMAAGAYHHHVGANIWTGARRASLDATGLLSVMLHIPAHHIEPLGNWLRAKRVSPTITREGVVVCDPDGIRLDIRGS